MAIGIGYALMEEYKPGETTSFTDYLCPTSMDVPPVEVIIVEDHEPTGPYGAKGIGEPALIPTAPAIINGINQAINVKIVDLPAKLERVMKEVYQGSNSDSV